MSVLNKLVLSPFEWSMSDRVSAAPMEFIVRLDCVGTIDAPKFSEAIMAELGRQPLFQANASVGETHRESFWRPASNCTPEIRWFDGNPDEGSAPIEDFVPIDLEIEIGFRFYGWRFYANNQNRIVMTFMYHHSCCDGKGGLGFVENVLHRYQCLVGDNTELIGKLAVVDEQQLLNRNFPSPNKPSFADRVWRALVIRPKRAGNMLLSKPRMFSRSANASGDGGDIDSELPQQCSSRLSLDETKQLGEFGRRMSVSTNTILARELFHTISDYLKNNSSANDENKTASAETEAQRNNRALRILIPFSLRDERHKHMPAANCVSMAYLEATQKTLNADSSSNPELLLDLTRQVDFIRRWNLQYAWIESLNSYAKIWPVIRFFKFGRKSRPKRMVPIATTVMTNLGRVFSEGELVRNGELAVKDLLVESVHVLPPCSSNIIVNFSVNFYGNRLTLDASYLASELTQKAAEGLLGSWKRRILDSATKPRIDR